MNTKASEVWREETLTESKGGEALIPLEEAKEAEEAEEVAEAVPPLGKEVEGSQRGKGQESEGNSGVLRRYTAEEDQLILEWWHDKKVRPQLAERLHRPLGGLAYRFYQILKARGIEPSEYRREMRALKRSQQGSVQEVLLRLESKGKSRGKKAEEGELFWTPEREMNLWRWRRAGLSWEEIAARLPGTTPWECKARYERLEQAQTGLV
ncbi:MAG: hypothetical protein QJR13_02130, partial [Bacillota bacterium]|nr:hypothetical protein [Bacillota bacterium]